jgi:hypothetical protein
MITKKFPTGDSISVSIGEGRIVTMKTIGDKILISPPGLQYTSVTPLEKPVVELDQKHYIWGDKVFVTIKDPWVNAYSDKIGHIGYAYGKSILISTRSGHNLYYNLQESGKNTGYYPGIIHLVGDYVFQRIGANNAYNTKDITFAHGSTDGKLVTSVDDEIVVHYQYGPRSEDYSVASAHVSDAFYGP